MADITPDQEAEEFEFRARAEEEARARQTAASNSQAGSLVEQHNTPGWMEAIEPALAAGEVAYGLASEHPVAAGLAATGAASVLGKVPYVGPALQKAAGAVVPTSIKTIAGAIPTAMSNWAGSIAGADAQTLQKLQSTALQYSKNNLPVPQDVARGIEQLSQKLYSKVPTAPIAPTGGMPTGPVAPTAMPGMPAAVPNAAPSVMNQLKSFAANKVLPMANSFAKGSVLSGLATYSPELGPQTPQVGRMKGSEINPLTSRPWTPDQIKQYEANPNAFDAQMAPPQMRR